MIHKPLCMAWGNADDFKEVIKQLDLCEDSILDVYEEHLTTMQSGETCQCYGYYTDVSGVKWLYVAYKNVVGFASSKYLKK